MKKMALRIGLISLCIVLISCGNTGSSKYPGYEKLEENLYLKYFSKSETGREVTVGDIVTMSMSYSLDNDSLLFDSQQNENQQPVQMQIDSSKYIGDLNGALLNLKEVDSVSVIVSAKNFFLKTAQMKEIPDFADSNSTIYFTIGIQKVESLQELQDAQAKENEQLRLAEESDRQAYLESNNITAEPTASGLIYIPIKKGSGKQATNGSIVRVNYSGKLLDGTYFDTSIEELAQEVGLYNPNRTYQPIEFTLGQGQVIPGWEEGIAMMKEGGKAQLIIPSDLAYGANPRPGGPIKPYSTLIFEVELVEVK